MKYCVIIIPKNKNYEDYYDTTSYYFETIQQVNEFIEIVMSSSDDSICQVSKVDGDFNG